MKIAFTIGNVPITIYDDSALEHEEEIHDLFNEYDELMESPVGSEEEEEPVCERLNEIRSELGCYGYCFDVESQTFK
jgi:hypothetical protein